MNEEPYLSVIIPAYKEGERIGRNLLDIDKYLKVKGFTYEIIVIVDGSPDNTAEVARNYALQIANLRVIDNKENHGKGYCVRQGLLEAKGKYRVFLDADGSTAITHWDAFEVEFGKGADVVIGDRDLPDSYIQIHQPKYREIMGDMGNLLIRFVLGLWGYADTQCGFKALNAEAAQAIAGRMVVDRFGFDFELVKLALSLGYDVKKMPVRWMNEAGSTVSLTGKNGFTQVLIDLAKTRWRLWTGFYKISDGKKSGNK
jgi:dolichyl-phosphate beta-glucosyltransferase